MNNALIVTKLKALIILGCAGFTQLSNNSDPNKLFAYFHRDCTSFSRHFIAHPDTRSKDEIARQLEEEARCLKEEAEQDRKEEAKQKRCYAMIDELKGLLK